MTKRRCDTMSEDAWVLGPFRQRLKVVVGERAAGDIIRFLESQGAIEGEKIIASKVEPALEMVFGKSTTALLKTIILKKSLAS